MSGAALPMDTHAAGKGAPAYQPASHAAAAVVQTTLLTEMTNATTLIRVRKTAGFGYDTPFYVRIDNEVMAVRFVEDPDSTTWQWTVWRGKNNTFAASHEAGSTVTLVNGQTNPQPPSSPEPLVAHPVSPTEIDLSWTASDRADGYHVFYWTGTAWQQFADLKGAAGTQLRAVNLAPNTTYYFYVEAYNAEGKSATKWVSARTLAEVAPTPPDSYRPKSFPPHRSVCRGTRRSGRRNTASTGGMARARSESPLTRTEGRRRPSRS